MITRLNREFQHEPAIYKSRPKQTQFEIAKREMHNFIALVKLPGLIPDPVLTTKSIFTISIEQLGNIFDINSDTEHTSNGANHSIHDEFASSICSWCSHIFTSRQQPHSV